MKNHFVGFMCQYKRYAPVLIAMYNGWDSIARFIPSVKILAMESRKWITGCVIARFLLVPAFYFTAKYADQGWMIFLTSFLGLSNGYLTVCIFSIAPKGYNVMKLLYICFSNRSETGYICLSLIL